MEYCLAGFGWNDLTKICDEKVECIPDEEDPPVVDPSVNPAGMRFVNNHYEKMEGQIKNGQSRDTGSIRYTKHRAKPNKTQHRKEKKDEQL